MRVRVRFAKNAMQMRRLTRFLPRALVICPFSVPVFQTRYVYGTTLYIDTWMLLHIMQPIARATHETYLGNVACVRPERCARWPRIRRIYELYDESIFGSGLNALQLTEISVRNRADRLLVERHGAPRLFARQAR